MTSELRRPGKRSAAPPLTLESSPSYKPSKVLGEVKRRPGASTPILFLDFDGVLHPHEVKMSTRGPVMSSAFPGHALFEHAERLALLLKGHREVRIVLSTSWVPFFGFNYSVSRLPSALQTKVVGATFDEQRDHAGFLSVSRGHQIVQEATRRGSKRWVCIDDVATDWPSGHRHRLVLSDPINGLGNSHVLAALDAALAVL